MPAEGTERGSGLTLRKMVLEKRRGDPEALRDPQSPGLVSKPVCPPGHGTAPAQMAKNTDVPNQDRGAAPSTVRTAEVRRLNGNLHILPSPGSCKLRPGTAGFSGQHYSPQRAAETGSTSPVAEAEPSWAQRRTDLNVREVLKKVVLL